MNRDDAKSILPLYRPGTADATDPQVAKALDLARRDPELMRWLETVATGQTLLRGKFRQIEPPAGLKEQIISEERAKLRSVPRRRTLLVAAAFACLALLVSLAVIQRGRRDSAGTSLTTFQRRMAGLALRGYAMDLQTADPARIKVFLGEHEAPADFVLPDGLKRLAESGCATPGWRETKVSMVCFRTGKPLRPGTQGDLWLFIVDQCTVTDSPTDGAVKLSQVNRLNTATWTRNGKLYFLGSEDGGADLKKLLL